MPHAQILGKETCAFKKCVQPVEDELGHWDTGRIVMIGYCQKHRDRIIARRLLGLE